MKKEIRLYLKKIGSKGGKKTFSKYTKEEWSERSKKAIKARWDRYRKEREGIS